MAGIKAGIKPDTLFCLSGWHNPNTFWKHYIIHNIPSSFTDLIFNINGDHEPQDYTTDKDSNNDSSQSNQDDIL